MPEKYTATTLRKREDRPGKPWQGYLFYSEPNPNYVPRPEEGEDTRTAQQKRKTVRKKLTKYFDPKTVKTKSQANKALQEWRAEMEARAQAPEYARVSVPDYVDAFLDGKDLAEVVAGKETPAPTQSGNTFTMSNGNVIEASTMKGYRSAAGHIRARFADTALQDLTEEAVAAWIADLRGRGYSLSVQGKDYRLLKMVCEHAATKGHVAKNPCHGVKAPSQPKADPNALTNEHRARLMAELERMEPTALVTSAYLALYMGLREGEICGLRWRDVDLDKNLVHVQGAIGQAEGGTYLKATKNDSSTRHLSMPGPLATKLAARRARMVGELAAAGVEPSADEFGALFVVGYVDGRYKNPNTLGKEWHVLAEAHGLMGTKGRAVKFHDLRHTFATVAVAQGVDIKSVSSFMGHTNAAMTLNIYASADPDAIAAAADVMGRAV